MLVNRVVKHYNVSSKTRTFKPDTYSAKLAPDVKVVSNNIFIIIKLNALTSEAFTNFIKKHDIHEFYITGEDVIACVKSAIYNMRKMDYIVHVIVDCITSYDKNKTDDMLSYYEGKAYSAILGCVRPKCIVDLTPSLKIFRAHLGDIQPLVVFVDTPFE